MYWVIQLLLYPTVKYQINMCNRLKQKFIFGRIFVRVLKNAMEFIAFVFMISIQETINLHSKFKGLLPE